MPQDTDSESTPNASVVLACPACKSDHLQSSSDCFECPTCGKRFPFENGFPDLVIGERFEDDVTCEGICCEDLASSYTTEHYWLPLFNRLWPDPHTPPATLSVGCGSGADVDILVDHGFNSMGIDPGQRSQLWQQRRHPDRLLLANGMSLPFDDDTFDVAYCGCVYPHVGVVGDTNQVSANCWQDRQRLADEMLRVVKPGGFVVASSPNRRFPLDLFHGREPGQYVPRLNPPWSQFLLSAEDYGRLFEKAGASNTSPLPVEGYWGFVRSKHTLAGTILGLPLRFLFWLVSRDSFAALRRSFISPWLIVLATKQP